MSGRVETILDAMASPHLFARWFKDEGTWAAWRAFLSALFGLGMDDGALDLFRACTGRSAPPEGPVSESWLIIGRRGGKSFALALVAVYLACLKDWRPYLSPGETGVVMTLARDRAQAQVIFNYIKALLIEVPVLAQNVRNITSERIELEGQVALEVHTASYGAIRGRTVIVGLLDELAFWSVEGANPDVEVLRAIRPAMSTIPGSLLLCASSPYARRGALYRAHRDHFGKDGPVLVWKAPTRVMNPTVPQSLVDAALAADRSAALAEYQAEFRSDVETFVAREAVEACVVLGRHELPPIKGVYYRAFVDPSGGSSDAMTLAIAHTDGDQAVVDVLRERMPPFSPESVVDEFAAMLRAYRVSSVTGDRYGGEWPRERFKRAGVQYVPAAAPKSDLYRDLLPALNSGQVDLPDHPKAVNQICALERRTARGGRDSIDHPPGAHDDLANALAGVIALCRAPKRHGPQVRSFADKHEPPAARGLSIPARALSYHGDKSFGDWLRDG